MYFHNGDFLSKETFSRNECLFEELYVSGIAEGHYLKSEIPYFYTSTNGHLSITTQIRSFDYYDADHDLLKTVELTFITECQKADNMTEEKGNERQNLSETFLIVLMVLMIFLVLSYERSKKHAKNRVYR
jgi:hypothetical protein